MTTAARKAKLSKAVQTCVMATETVAAVADVLLEASKRNEYTTMRIWPPKSSKIWRAMIVSLNGRIVALGEGPTLVDALRDCATKARKELES